MRWPLVARSALDAERRIVDLLHDELRDARKRLDDRDARIAQLNDMALRMTREGWTPPPPQLEPIEEKPLPPVVESALWGLQLPAGERLRDEAMVRGWLNEGMDATEAARRLIEGGE